MLFAIICTDKPGQTQTRMDNRPDHVAYLEKLNAAGTLKFAGPFLDDNEQPRGSLVMVEAESREAAAAIAAKDPYALAGLFETVEIHRWNWTFNNPEKA